MINYSKRLGENMFDRMFPTTPGRVDPSTGMLVMTDQISLPELRAMAEERRRGQSRGYDRGEDRGRNQGPDRGDDRSWGGSGRGDDRGRGGESRPQETAFTQMKNAYHGMRRPGMSGPYLVEQTGILQNPALWLIVGTGILIALEANGVTHLSGKA
jgi:hypothetical protein